MNKIEPRVTVVDYAGHSFLGILTADGQFRIEFIEVLNLFLKSAKMPFVQFKLMTGLELSSQKKIRTHLDDLAHITLSLDDLKAIAVVIATKKDKKGRPYYGAVKFVQEMQFSSVEDAYKQAFSDRWPLTMAQYTAMA